MNSAPCIHHFWVEEPRAEQKTVQGVCKHCGIERPFMAWWDEDMRWSAHRSKKRREIPQ